MLVAQANVRDSTIFIPMFTIHYAFQIPSGDLEKRFGSNSAIGGSFMIKTKKNWLYGAEGSFLFGNNLKEDTILNSITNKDGFIIDGQGIYTNINLSERGFFGSIKGGKIFPFYGPNKNSGIMITGSAGFFEHRIRIDVTDNTAPQLQGDYKKGYDRLTSGIGISEFIGYIYLGNKRLISFYGGIEFTQAWTKSRRKWDFDRMGPDNSKRHDYLYGIKIGWIIPLYQRASKSGYYYF